MRSTLYEMKTILIINAGNIPSMKSEKGVTETFNIPEPVLEYIQYQNRRCDALQKEVEYLKSLLNEGHKPKGYEL